MKKTFIGLIIVIVVICVIIIGRNNNKDIIKIGFIGPFSGDAATYGETEKNATELALKKIQNSPEYRNQTIQIVYEDGGCNAKTAISAAQKLIEVDKVSIIFGGICSGETLAVAPLAEKSHVLLFSAYSSSPDITTAGDYVFRNGPSDLAGASKDAEFLSKRYAKVGIVSENAEYSVGVRNALKNELEKKGIQIVFDEMYVTGTRDFRTILGKVNSTGPDVIYYNAGTSPLDAVSLLKQAREIGIKTPAHFNFFLGNPDVIKSLGDLAEGVGFADTSSLKNSGEILLDEYVVLYGAPSNEYELGAAYDRVFITMQALNKVGNNSEKIKNYLYNMPTYHGTVGDYQFDSNGDIVGAGYKSYVIKNGEKVPVDN